MALVTKTTARRIKYASGVGTEYYVGAPAPTWSETTNYLDWTDFREGGVNPNFKKDIARGRNATTYMRGTLSKADVPALFVQYERDNYSYTPPRRWRKYWTGTCTMAYGIGQWPVDPTGISVTKANERAVIKAYKAIREINQSFQGMTFLGELGESLRMIKGRSRQFYRGLFRYAETAKKRTRRMRNNAKKNAVVSNTWLEYSFGWAPLLSDVKNGIETVQKSNIYRGDSVAFKAIGYSPESISHQSSDTLTQPPVDYTWTSKTEAWVNIYGRVGVSVQTTDILNAGWWGFDLTSFLPTVWELTPYSFLIDYFTNVGDLISAWSTPTSNVRWLSRSTRQKSSRTLTRFNLDMSYLNGLSDYVKGSARITYQPIAQTRLSIVRERDYSLELPSFQWKIPGTSMKWLNIAALGRLKTLR